MTYFTVENGLLVYVGTDNGRYYHYDKEKDEWIDSTTYISDAQVGYDPYEPEGSPYRYGCGSCMKEFNYMSKEEAEKRIGKVINEQEIGK